MDSYLHYSTFVLNSCNDLIEFILFIYLVCIYDNYFEYVIVWQFINENGVFPRIFSPSHQE